MWIRLVQDTRSTSEYTRNRIPREHILTVEDAEDNEYELLRIDISDKMYLDSLNLIYCDKDGEKSLGDGTKMEQDITKHFLFFAPASGKYKIETKGAQYTYNVWALKGPLLPPVLEPQIYSPFDVIIGLKEHIDLFTAHVLHRVEGSEQWTAADFFQKNIHIGGLDATKTYEFKAQLIIPDLLETEESEIVKVSNMNSMVDKFRPDEFLLNSMLKFIVRDVPPYSCAITLQVKFPFEDWIRFAPSALQMGGSADLRDIYGNGEYIDESEDEEGYMGEISYLIYRLEKFLYDKLDQDTVVEWQLIFKERTTQRVVHGPIVPFQLKKRPIGFEQMPKSMHFEKDRSRFFFHVGKNGEFQYEDVEQRKFNIKGRFTIEYASDNYMRLSIVPQTNFNQPIYNLNLSVGSSHEVFSVAEILDAILDDTITTQNDAVWIGDIIHLNLVNKEFYASIRRVLKIRAAIFDEDRLVIAHWIPAALRLSDVRVFTDCSDY